MYSKVKRLRVNGERKREQDISADPGQVGHMTLVLCRNVRELSLFAPGDTGRRQLLLPVLYRATAVTIHGDRMLFQGYERTGDPDDPESPVIQQEWAVEVMAEQPPTT